MTLSFCPFPYSSFFPRSFPIYKGCGLPKGVVEVVIGMSLGRPSVPTGLQLQHGVPTGSRIWEVQGEGSAVAVGATCLPLKPLDITSVHSRAAHVCTCVYVCVQVCVCLGPCQRLGIGGSREGRTTGTPAWTEPSTCLGSLRGSRAR